MLLSIDGLILYELLVLIIVGVTIITLIAYRREKEGINKEFLGYMLIPTSLLMISTPLIIYEMFRYLIS